jgi:uncharacterized membrane protein
MSEKNFGALVLVLAVLAGFTLWFSVGGYMAGMMGMMYGWGYTAFLPFAVVGLLVVGAYLLLTELIRPRSVNTTARRMLNTRYARGEITRAQYLEMKRELDT